MSSLTMPPADAPQPDGAPRSIAGIASYHAHIYYDVATTRGDAEILRQQMADRFSVRLGSWHDKQVGPHGQSMYQVAFGVEVFARLVPWLMLNRRGLSVLIHPNTDRPRDDHLLQSLWLGRALPVKGEVLDEELPAGEAPESLSPNTNPHLDDI
jgi:aromatic ring-cleaving dioxygenase